MNIQNIIQAIDAQNYRITHHADEGSQDDGLDFEGIFYSVHHGEVIENYPEDRPYPREALVEVRSEGAGQQRGL